MSSSHLKRASQSLKRSLGRVRKPLLNLFKAPPPPEPTQGLPDTPNLHVLGILGMVGPLNARNSGFMTTDFGAWMFLVSLMDGFDRNRCEWKCIRPIGDLFPEGFVIFGEAGCDRLQLPLPPILETDIDRQISAHRFGHQCVLSLQTMARQVQAGEKLVLLLIGHGALADDGFRFLITTDTNRIDSESYLTKDNLEDALKDCKGDILVICNSCYSGDLSSENWTLLCSGELVTALTESSSGYFRGSVFTECVVAQAAKEYGLRVPFPRTEPRATQDVPLPLPPSPPSHSFSTSASLSFTKPVNASFKELTERMEEMHSFLVDSSCGVPVLKGPQSMVSWMRVFPVRFTPETKKKITIKASPPDFSIKYNTMFTVAPVSQGQTTTASGPPFKIPPRLENLVKLMPDDIKQVPLKHDTICYEVITALRQHLSDPQQNAIPPQAGEIGAEELLSILRSIHVQSIAVQQIAKEMGWCKPTEIAPFLQRLGENWEYIDMIKKGVKVDKLPEYFRRQHFKQYPFSTAMDRNSARWLSAKWTAAGSPSMTESQWDAVAKKVAIMAEKVVVRD